MHSCCKLPANALLRAIDARLNIRTGLYCGALIFKLGCIVVIQCGMAPSV